MVGAPCGDRHVIKHYGSEDVEVVDLAIDFVTPRIESSKSMNSDIRAPATWTPESLSAQWDSVAPARNSQLRSGRDVSFEHVLKPTVLKLIEPSPSGLLDAGCGSGS